MATPEKFADTPEKIPEAPENAFDDQIGQEVLNSIEKIESNFKELNTHLEKQFEEEDTTTERLDDIINILNNKESSPKKANNDFEEVQEPSDSINNKILDLVDTLKTRNPDVQDEWDNDDDAGYMTLTLTENEFFELEQRNASNLYESKNKQVKESENKIYNQSKPFSSDKSQDDDFDESLVDGGFGSNLSEGKNDYVPSHKDPFELHQNEAKTNKRQSVGERRRSEVIGQHRFQGADGTHCFFNLKVIFEPYKTGFEETKDLKHAKGTIIAGRYQVYDVLGQAAFSTALQCIDLAAEEDECQWVCLKVIKNNKDFFDQSLDEIKLLQYINSHGDPDENHVLRVIDFFYCKEHLFIVSELLKENLYEFGRYIRENILEPYYTLPRLKRISKQVLEALSFIHSLKLIHCDVKPENIVIKSFSRCEVKLIDFGSSCFTTDHLTTYIQSRSYRAPEVILGLPYDARIDVWSVGAVIAELFTGYVLFQNDSVPTMLSRITGILGPFPEEVLLTGRETSKYFTLNGIVYEKDEEDSYHLIFPKKTSLKTRLHLDDTEGKSPEQIKDEDLFLDFIASLLHLDPKKRLTARQALKHPWLADADTVKFTEYIIGQPAAPPDDVGEEDDEEEEDYNEEDSSEEIVSPEKEAYYATYERDQLGEFNDDGEDEDEDAGNESDSREDLDDDPINKEIYEELIDESDKAVLTLDDEIAMYEAENEAEENQ